jgi:hypothetical protein
MPHTVRLLQLIQDCSSATVWRIRMPAGKNMMSMIALSRELYIISKRQADAMAFDIYRAPACPL